jgi:predicted Fe-S protein YdhL (DUF1289 family)
MVESPCNKVCVLDRITGFCIGCGRSGAEIGAWPTMAEEARAALVALLPHRLAAMPSRGARRQAR